MTSQCISDFIFDSDLTQTKTKTRFNVLSLFSGAGGFDQGFIDDDHNIVCANEIVKHTAETYRLNHPGTPLVSNDILESIHEIRKNVNNERIDVVIGGPPCQEFSTAGTRMIGERADLSVTYIRIALSYQPKWIIMENVPAIKREGKNHLIIIKETLKHAGYDHTEIILRADDFGVPQKRYRYFLVAYRGKLSVPILRHLVFQQREKKVSVREYFKKVNHFFPSDHYFYCALGFKTRKMIYSLDRPAPTIIGTLSYSMKSYQRSHTINFKNLDNLTEITNKDCAVIQTFPLSYKFVGSVVNQRKQIGNAVPPKLAKVIAVAISRYDQTKNLTH